MLLLLLYLIDQSLAKAMVGVPFQSRVLILLLAWCLPRPCECVHMCIPQHAPDSVGNTACQQGCGLM